MKSDVLEGGLPPIPRKRRQLEEQATFLDLHIAIWLDRDDITPSERRRLEEEKKRRKALKPDVVVGIIVGMEGVTPGQLAFAHEFLQTAGATAIAHTTPLSKKMARLFPEGVPVSAEADFRDVVRAATVVVAAPKEPEKPNQVQGVWEGVRYAKHRRVPVRVVMPSGDER